MRAFAIVVFVTLTLAATAPARVVSFGDEPPAALPEYDVAGDATDGTVLADVRDYFEERSYDGAFEAYVELWNKQRSALFEPLPRGETVTRYRLRAEVPGAYTALPARVHGMCSPDIGSTRPRRWWGWRSRGVIR